MQAYLKNWTANSNSLCTGIALIDQKGKTNVASTRKNTLTLPIPKYWAMMAGGMAKNRSETLVPRRTTWRFIRSCLNKEHPVRASRAGSDFFLRDEHDKLCGVLTSFGPLLLPSMTPFSMLHASLGSISQTVSGTFAGQTTTPRSFVTSLVTHY